MSAHYENGQVLYMNLFAAIFGLFWILICKVMNQRSQERLFMVKVLKVFLFSWPIFVFTIHSFPSYYNCNQSVNMLK